MFGWRLSVLRRNVRLLCSPSLAPQSVESGDSFGEVHQAKKPKAKKRKKAGGPRDPPHGHGQQLSNYGGPKRPDMFQRPGLPPVRRSLSGANSAEVGSTRIFRSWNQNQWKRDASADNFGTVGSESDKVEQVHNLKAMKTLQYRKLPGLALERVEEQQKGVMEPEFVESDDEDLVEVSPVFGKKHDPFWYLEKCQELIKQNKIVESVAMLEKRMIQEDRVHPVFENFQVVLNALGRAGYCRKAFELFTLMGRKHVDAKKYTYTSLWNSCAHCENPELGLEKARWLLDLLDRKGILLERIHYHALIKVFGRHGDLEFAFKLVDRMMREKFFPDSETYSHLLQGCISDKETGFKLAVEVWRKMASQRFCQPQLWNFNLLLRACRDCGLGTPEFANELLNVRRSSLPPPAPQKVAREELNASSISGEISPMVAVLRPLEAEGIDPVWGFVSGSWSNIEKVETVVNSNSVQAWGNNSSAERASSLDFERNLLNPEFGGSGEILSLAEVSKKEDKFLLIGGVRGILSLMQRNGVQPDIKTFTEMLELIPDTRKSEEALLSYMEWAEVSGDVDFFNLVLKKRCLRHDREGAVELLSTFRTRGVAPDVRTFGALAINCGTRVEAAEILRDMKAYGVEGNLVIFGSLLQAALEKKNFWYALDVVKEMKAAGIKPDEMFLRNAENHIKNARQKFGQAGLDSGSKFKEYFQSEEAQKGFAAFLSFYDNWLKRTPLIRQEDKETLLNRNIEEMNTDDLRDPWDKPWEKQKPKYE